MTLRLNIIKDSKHKSLIRGGKLILPMEPPVIEVYEDVTLFEPDDIYYVVAVHYHQSEDVFSGVYFYFDDVTAANTAKYSINQTFSLKVEGLELGQVKLVEIENHDTNAFPRHQVFHYDLVNKEKHQCINPFQQGRVA